MSNEQKEQDRDANASTESPRTDPSRTAPHATAPETAPSASTGPGPGHAGPTSGSPVGGGVDPGTSRSASEAQGATAGARTGGSEPPVAEKSPPRHRRQRPAMVGIVAAALIAGVVGGGAGLGGAYAALGHTSSSPVLASAPTVATAARTTVGTVAGAAAKAMPSTVDIRVSLTQGRAEGSGVILTADGNVLTNNHVVAGATGPITVTLADGSQHPATVVGTAPSYDLAVIKIQGVSGLTPATLGHSADVRVGQQVVAIGSPQGVTGTVTQGIVSAFDRTVSVPGPNGSAVVYNGLQTDAPINPGNSGGPLVNLGGQLVGINSAIATAGGQGGGSVGLGFAIPVDQAARVAQQILSNGMATKPLLGVQGATASPTAASLTGSAGAQIGAVTPGSPAAQAGLSAGDVVTKVGNDRVLNFSDLIARIGAHAPGQRVTLTLTNGGGTQKTVNVTLGSQPDVAASSTGGQISNPSGSQPFTGN